MATAILSGFAERSAAQRVSIDRTEAPLEAVFGDIRKQTGYSAVIPMALLRQAGPITLKADGAELREVLAELHERTGYTFTIPESQKIIRVEAASRVVAGSDARHRASEKLNIAYPEVRGRVVDSLGNPLPGASIRVLNTEGQRTTVQAKTDHSGEFILRNVPYDATIEISHMGYIAQTVPARANMGHVTLREMFSALEEVMVSTGYWETTKKLSTSSISKITAETIEKQPVTNVLQAIQGLVPGMVIESFNGLPGSNFFVQIRGRNSLRNEGNFPLYIIDGIPYPTTSLHSTTVASANGSAHPLNSIQPSDIESIEVLKDADATAIYGSRGANGVIVINTKRVKKRGASIDLNLQSGISQVAKFPKLLNTQQWLEMRNEAFRNDGAVMTQANAPDLLLWDTTRYTDWQKELIGGTARNTQANLSFQGGNQTTNFLFRSSYYTETTVFPGDFRYQRGSAHLNANHTFPSEKVKVDFTVTYTADKNDLPRNDLTTQAIALSPNAPAVYDENGNLNWENGTWANPYASLYNEYNGNTYNLIANSTFAYMPVNGLTLKTIGGYNILRMEESVINPIKSFNPALNNTGQTYIADKRANSWIVEPQAVYERDFGSFYANAMIGGTIQESLRNGKVFRGFGYTSDMLIRDLNAAPNVTAPSTEYLQYRYLSTYGRLNFRIQNQYIVNFTTRRDGSTRFGPGRQFANFFSVGTAWIFSETNFLKNAFPGMSLGKLRMSYGTTGSDQIGDYQYFETYSSYSNPYNGEAGLYPVRLANPEFAWEVNRKFEAALETGFMRDRILLNVNWYKNRSSNQLVGYPLPAITGFESIQYNMPAVVQNTGWEFDVNADIIAKHDFRWSISANATIPKNKLVAFPGIEQTSYASSRMVGKSLLIVNRYHYTGVDPNTGIYTYQDINEDGVLNTDDRVLRKMLGQNYYGGFQNSVSYKGWHADIFLQFVRQTGVNYLGTLSRPPGSQFSNQLTIVMGRWQKPGDNTNIQKFSQAAGSEASRAYSTLLSVADNSIGDASFIRLQNVGISKTFNNILKFSQSGKIFLQAQNLLTMTKYQGFNPETKTMGSLPPMRRLIIGFQILL